MPRASANAWASCWRAWGRRAVKAIGAVVAEWYHYDTTSQDLADLLELRQARRLRRPSGALGAPAARRPRPCLAAALQETEERGRVFIGKTLDECYL